MTKIAVLALVLVAFVAGPAAAQQPSHEHGTQATPAPAGPPPAGGPAQPGGMMQGGMCAMMMGGQAESPRMLQMRGEMMKAMGEIMMKYGTMTETPASAR